MQDPEKEIESSDQEDGVARTRLCAALCLVGFAAFLPLDFLVAPASIFPMLATRTVTEMILGLLLAASYTSWSRHHTKTLAFFLFLVACSAIVVLDVQGGGTACQYHQILALMYISYAALMPNTATATAVGTLSMTALFAALITRFNLGGAPSLFLTNISSLVLAAVISTMFAHTGERLKAKARASRRLSRENFDLARHARELIQIDLMKTEFYANVNHELRTPLTLILAHAELAESELSSASRTQVLDHLHACRRSGEKLLKMVTDMLDVSRIEMGKTELVKSVVDTVKFLHDIVYDVEKIALQKEISLIFCAPQLSLQQPSESFHILADLRQLERMVTNLLTNALKFTDSGGRVVVNLHATDGWLCLSVSDNGRGISREALPRIFERGFQEQHTAGLGGLGIGLYLVRGIAEAHGGRVEVVSEVGRGTTFSIYLPAGTTAARSSPIGEGAAS